VAKVAPVPLPPFVAIRTRARGTGGEDERTKGRPAMHAVMLHAVSDVVICRMKA
jgi:hypothetical protein